MDWIEIDGSEGEGGGQRIRARRNKPGLLRQHLTAVQGAAAVSGARVTGAELGPGELRFEPGTVRGGEHRFAVGTAGSATPVVQRVLPALAGGGSFRTVAPTQHTLTNADVIRRFLDVDIRFVREKDACRVVITSGKEGAAQ